MEYLSRAKTAGRATRSQLKARRSRSTPAREIELWTSWASSLTMRTGRYGLRPELGGRVVVAGVLAVLLVQDDGLGAVHVLDAVSWRTGSRGSSHSSTRSMAKAAVHRRKRWTKTQAQGTKAFCFKEAVPISALVLCYFYD